MTTIKLTPAQSQLLARLVYHGPLNGGIDGNTLRTVHALGRLGLAEDEDGMTGYRTSAEHADHDSMVVASADGRARFGIGA